MIINSFSSFLDICKEEPNHHQQNVKTTFEEGWKPLFDEYRSTGELEKKFGNKHIVLSGLKEYSLTDEEAFFILTHTGSYSSWINHLLRDGYPLDTDCKKYFAQNLNNALS